MASLGLVSPGAATDGCQPIFPSKNLTIFSLVIVSESDYLFLAVVSSPLPSSHTRHLSSVLSKFSHKKINFRSGVTPLESVTRGGPPPSLLVTPLSAERNGFLLHISSQIPMFHVSCFVHVSRRLLIFILISIKL